MLKLAKYRINPGNVGRGEKHDDNFATMIKIANKYNKPVRIGVNWGSLDQELFTQLMDENAALAQPKDFKKLFIKAIDNECDLTSAKKAEELGIQKKISY